MNANETGYTYSDEQTTDSTYNGIGFLQTAFTNSAQSLIATTTVDNSAASTTPASNASEWNSGTNDYVDIMYGGVVPALCLSSLE